MMVANPTVGIVVCTHEKPERLRNALAVISSQTYRRVVVAVVDDCSQCAAENRQVVGSYAGEIDYLLNPTRQGVSRTRDRGLRHLMEVRRPDLVCMLDDDDHWPVDRLANGVAVTTEHVGMSYGIQWMTDERLQPLFKYPSRTSYVRALTHALLFGEFTFPAKTYMFCARFLDELQIAPSQWYVAVESREDVELGVRALRHAARNPRWRIVFSNRLLAYWVQQSTTKFFSADHVRRQQAGHATLVREYFPSWLQRLALATAPYTIRMPDCVRHAIL